MNNLSNNNVPWELITQSLTDTLTVEEEIQLQKWFSSDPANKEKYRHIQDLWKNGLEDYMAYKEADENKAWKALNVKLGRVDRDKSEIRTLKERFMNNKSLRNLVAVAAVFLGLVVIGFWIVMSVRTPAVYETLANAEKKVVLKDGSSISLKPLTKIELARGFNKTNRTVIMIYGEAFFEVFHQKEKPFIVELGKTQVKDIGTSFTIRKGEKEISVAVISGKVEFIKLGTKETRALSAGNNITFNIQKESFGKIKTDKASGNFGAILNFDNTPLSDAIVSIQEVYGKKIILDDEGIVNKKITAHLHGMPFNTVMDVICKSLGLEYSVHDNTYILKERK